MTDDVLVWFRVFQTDCVLNAKNRPNFLCIQQTIRVKAALQSMTYVFTRMFYYNIDHCEYCPLLSTFNRKCTLHLIVRDTNASTL